MNAWSEEFKTIRERVHRYIPPLPKRKQRVQQRAERSGKCIHYDCLDCFFLGLQQQDQRLALEVANLILILWEE